MMNNRVIQAKRRNKMTKSVPDEELLEAFGSKGKAELLSGGEGNSYLAGNMVLKPIDNIDEATWVADLMNVIVEDGFRVAKPIKSKNGTWIYRGWTAFKYLEGETSKKRWKEKIEVSHNFHKALVYCKRPAFFDTKTNPYVVADQMTWGIQLLKINDKLKSFLAPLITKLRPILLEDQLIHGDLTGNILFHETLPPAVIDMTPYWHPAKYADAIIAVDSIVWDGADDLLFDLLDNSFEMNQLLLRAAIWRIKITDEFIRQGKKESWDFVDHYRHFIELLFLRMKNCRG